MFMKLDMTNAYHRLEWAFLMAVLAKMGLNEIFCDRIWRLIANN